MDDKELGAGRAPEYVDEGMGLLALVGAYADEVDAHAALIARWEGDRRVGRISAGYGLERFEMPDLIWADGIFAGLDSEPVAHGPSRGWSQRENGATGQAITYAVAARIATTDGAPAAIAAGFAGDLPFSISTLLWRSGSYAAAAELCLPGERLAALLAAGRHDTLTGCLNYLGLREALSREVNRSQRHRRPFSCMFVDLDGFRRVNAERGHVAANEVLGAAGAAIRQAVRESDTVGRFGGDEFVVILPDTTEAAAWRLVDRIEDAIRRRTGALGRPVGASAGVVEWSGGKSDDDLLTEVANVMRDSKWARTDDGDGQIAPIVPKRAQEP